MLKAQIRSPKASWCPPVGEKRNDFPALRSLGYYSSPMKSRTSAVDIDELVVGTLDVLLLVERSLKLFEEDHSAERQRKLDTANWLLDGLDKRADSPEI